MFPPAFLDQSMGHLSHFEHRQPQRATRQRAIHQPVRHLTPGVLYIFRIRAVGGLTGYSDWSNVVTGRSL